MWSFIDFNGREFYGIGLNAADKKGKFMAVTFEDIQKAHAAIKSSTIRTPIVRAARLSLHLGIDLYLKLENLQHTNAF